jgi:hypothetical protein
MITLAQFVSHSNCVFYLTLKWFRFNLLSVWTLFINNHVPTPGNILIFITFDTSHMQNMLYKQLNKIHTLIIFL